MDADTGQRRSKVFISYSHAEPQYLAELQRHLKPLERQGLVDRWDDSRIQRGSNWHDEIRAALRATRVGVFLVSSSFLASDFIADEELAILRDARQAGEVVVLWVLLSPCRYDLTGFVELQCAHDPQTPLAAMSPAQRDAVWVDLTHAIQQALPAATTGPSAPHQRGTPIQLPRQSARKLRRILGTAAGVTLAVVLGLVLVQLIRSERNPATHPNPAIAPPGRSIAPPGKSITRSGGDAWTNRELSVQSGKRRWPASLEALRPALTGLAGQVAGILQQRGKKNVSLGHFQGSFGKSRIPASAAPAIQSILAEELEKQGVVVQAGAAQLLEGEYHDGRNAETGQVVLVLRASLVDSGKSIPLTREIAGGDTIVRVLGINRPDLGGAVAAEQESTALLKLIAKPQVIVKDGRVCGLPDALNRPSPYAIEVHVKTGDGFARRPAIGEAGVAWTTMQRGEVFGVNLVNDSEYDAAVELTLDGVNLFAFSKHTRLRHLLIPRKGRILVPGWHLEGKRWNEFKVTEIGKSVVAELGTNRDAVGTITATFAAAWNPLREKRPADEEDADKSTARGGDAIGRGGEIEVASTEVKRICGRTRAVINVRYRKPTK